MKDSILHVLQYYAFFSYPPTIEEVYLFLNVRVSERDYKLALQELVSSKQIYIHNDRISLNVAHFDIFQQRKELSGRYFQIADRYIPFLSLIPSIRLIGISGSLSMQNVKQNGDIDLFVITSPGLVWTTRFILLLYKHLIKTVQKDVGETFCLNLFFSEKGLQIPLEKQNEYIGHELLQLKPIIDQEDTYELLLQSNSWINQCFPNIASKPISKTRSKTIPFYTQYVLSIIEFILKNIQTWWLKRKGFTWKEHNEQLWLIQEDFEMKLPNIKRLS